jgi:hypothetical protein
VRTGKITGKRKNIRIHIQAVKTFKPLSSGNPDSKIIIKSFEVLSTSGCLYQGALGKPETTVRQAWRGSRRNFWRLLAGCVLSSLAAVVLLLLAGLLKRDVDEASQPLACAAWETFTDLGIAFLAGMPVISLFPWPTGA